jgi:pre-rRNA-processing protein TSR2
LDEALQIDFNVQAEDDSPYQIARSLVNMHHRVAQGDFSYLESLRQQQPASAAACQNADGAAATEESSSSSDDEGSGSDSDDAMDAEGGEDMDMDEAPPVKSGPVVDEDGFQVVQRKGRGGGRK